MSESFVARSSAKVALLLLDGHLDDGDTVRVGVDGAGLVIDAGPPTLSA